MSVHFSSATDLWATPQDFFDKLNKWVPINGGRVLAYRLAKPKRNSFMQARG